MAQVIIKPAVVDFLNLAMVDKEIGLAMEEARVKKGSPLVGKNLIESNLRKDFGIIIVAIKKYTGDMIFNPMANEYLEEEDVLVVLGKNEDLSRMNMVI